MHALGPRNGLHDLDRAITGWFQASYNFVHDLTGMRIGTFRIVAGTIPSLVETGIRMYTNWNIDVTRYLALELVGQIFLYLLVFFPLTRQLRDNALQKRSRFHEINRDALQAQRKMALLRALTVVWAISVIAKYWAFGPALSTGSAGWMSCILVRGRNRDRFNLSPYEGAHGSA